MRSAESVGEGGLGEVAEAVVKSGGGHVIAAEAVGAADDDLELVVEALDGAGGDGRAGAEPVEDEVAFLLEGAGDLGDGLDAGGLGGAAPVEQEGAGEGDAEVAPELAQLLLEQVGTDGFQVELEQPGERDGVLLLEGLRRAEQQPACVLEDRRALAASASARMMPPRAASASKPSGGPSSAGR